MSALKTLLVVLSIAWAVFAIAKPICLRFMAEPDFARRRNTWLTLTGVAFLAPNFWVFAGVALPVLYWAGRKDSNPVAFYAVMLHVVPPFGVQLPTILINNLFELNQYRLLALAVLLPTALDLWRRGRRARPAVVATMDRLLLAHAALALILIAPYGSATDTMRRAFLLGLDVLLLYFVVSRGCTSRRRMLEVLAALAVPMAIAAPLALFETLARTQLYAGIGNRWDIPYLYWAEVMRGDALRAPAFAGHALALGYLMAMAFVLWLQLRMHLPSKTAGHVGVVWIWAGLAATLSRGPVLVAVVAYFIYMAVSRLGAARFLKPLLVALLIGGFVLISPLGDAVISLLPFVGTVDSDNVIYRQRLAEVSWGLIQQNPLLGDPFFMANMEELRQGQGIVDLVNVYAAVALQSGIVGLALFLGVFLVGLRKVLLVALEAARTDRAMTDIGACLAACMVGTLVMMVTGSFGTSLEKMYYILAGLAAAFVSIESAQTDSTNPVGERDGRPSARRAVIAAAGRGANRHAC